MSAAISAEMLFVQTAAGFEASEASTVVAVTVPVVIAHIETVSVVDKIPARL